MESTSQRPPVWPDILSQLNKLTGLILTLGSALMLGQEWGPVGGVIGLIGGGLAAVITCGTVMLLLDIRRILLETKEQAKAP